MPTYSDDPVICRTHNSNPEFAGGVYGESKLFNGVRGVTYAPGHGAVVGISENHTNQAGPGVFGQSDAAGVWGLSKTWHGVAGFSESTTGGFGVYGEAVGSGVVGVSKSWHGVYGESPSTTGGAGVWGEHKGGGTGVVGKSAGGVGVWGTSDAHEGVHAETHSSVTAAIAAYNLNSLGTGAAIYAKKEGTAGHAGFFDGNVWISGDLGVGRDIILANADCAEDFDIADGEFAEPGAVMVLTDAGCLRESFKPYDKRVAGVVSGAGEYKPAIRMDSRPESDRRRKPVALLGKVYCKADASYAPIEVGDLLTTSPTTGHAMKAADATSAFGSVIGKALKPLESGRGLIPILISLQ